MSYCKNCIHYKICKYWLMRTENKEPECYGSDDCEFFESAVEEIKVYSKEVEALQARLKEKESRLCEEIEKAKYEIGNLRDKNEELRTKLRIKMEEWCVAHTKAVAYEFAIKHLGNGNKR